MKSTESATAAIAAGLRPAKALTTTKTTGGKPVSKIERLSARIISSGDGCGAGDGSLMPTQA